MKRFIALFCAIAPLIFASCGLLVEQGREIVAEVGGEPIRLNDLLEQIRELPFEQRTKTNDPDPSVRMQSRRAVLESVVTERLFAKEATARGIEVSDEEVKADFKSLDAQQDAMNNLAEGMKDTSEHHEHRANDEDYSRGEFKRMREKLMIEKMLRQQFSDAALRKYYDDHIQNFSISPRLAVYELLVVDAKNKGVAEKVGQKAAQEGTTLAATLAGFEPAPPVVFSGVLPPSSLNSLVPEMRQEVENLKAGEVSKLFRLRPQGKEGYAVARVVNYIERTPFENVKQRIYARLFREFLEELQQKYKVVYYQDKLNYQLGS